MNRKAKKLAKTGAALTGAYFAAIMPRLANRPEPMPKVYYAHRGLHDNGGDAPENTLAAFQKAVDAGYGIELDVQLARDGHVVVAHDMHLKRNCGIEKNICQATYGELQQYPVFGSDQRIPLFEDVLKLVDGRVPLIVEYKSEFSVRELCRKTDALLQKYTGVYCIESFDPRVLLWYRANRPKICRGQLSFNYQKEKKYEPPYFAMRHLLTDIFTAPDFIAYDCTDKKAVSLVLCRKLYRCPAFAWTVKSAEELKEVRPYFDYFIFEGFRP
ncbi:MAG: glycerophosphodiester phosphodiesterase [Lachnospiraceae bacterium]|nr:glycerophosphodiester phosphodiesterase [Lachnospiraceae bacterium]